MRSVPPDYSLLSCLDRCPRLCYYTYILGRSLRTENVPLSFGTSYHLYRKVIEDLYRAGSSPIDAHSAALEQVLSSWTDPPEDHPKAYLNSDRLTKTLSKAYENWLAEKTIGAIRVIDSETYFELTLPSGRPFCGRFDQIVEWGNRLWVRDFKTVSRRDDWNRTYAVHHQFSGYVWAASQLTNKSVMGVLVEVVHNTKTTGPEFETIITSRSKDDIDWWLEWVEDAIDSLTRYIGYGRWPMRTSACNDWGGCPYRECCRLGSWPAAKAWLEDHTVESHWDPSKEG